MKRSEAILNIVNVLRLTGNHYCDDGRDEQDAERILKRLEAIGLLPPKFNKAKNATLNYGDVITSEFTFINWVHEWESEDEEK